MDQQQAIRRGIIAAGAGVVVILLIAGTMKARSGNPTPASPGGPDLAGGSGTAPGDAAFAQRADAPAAAAPPNAPAAPAAASPGDALKHLQTAKASAEEARAALAKATTRNHGGYVEKARANVAQLMTDMDAAIDCAGKQADVDATPANTSPAGVASITHFQTIQLDEKTSQTSLLKAFKALAAALDEVQNAGGGDLGGNRDKLLANLDHAATNIFSGFDMAHTGSAAATMAAPRIAPPPADAPAAGALPEPSDPLLWTPADPGPIDAKMDEAAYQQQRKASLNGIDKVALADGRAPISGVYVVDVTAGSAAEARGIAPGAIIVAINGQANPTNMQLSAAARSEKNVTLSVWSPEGQRDIAFDPGVLGIASENWLALDRYYWRTGPRDPAWQDDLLVAAAEYERNPTLALAALQHAHAAGCKDQVVDLFRAMAAAMADRNQEALEVGLPLLAGAPDAIKPRLAALLCNAAIAAYHPQYALRVNQTVPVVNDDFMMAVQTEIGFHQSLPQAARQSRPPILEAQKMALTDYSAALQPVTTSFDALLGPSLDLSYWTKANDLKFNAPSGSFQSLHVGPKIKNFTFGTELAFGGANAVNSDWVKFAGLQIYNDDPTVNFVTPLLRVQILASGKVSVSNAAALPEVQTNAAWFADRQKHQLAIMLVNYRVEVAVDNHPIYDGPVVAAPEQRQLFGAVVVSGMKAEMTKLSWGALSQKP